MTTILEYINQKVDGFDALLWGTILLIVWCIIWRLFLGPWLCEHDVGTFWYEIFEVGPLGVFGIVLVALLLIVLMITSLQIVFSYEPKVIVAVASFWAIIISFVILIIRYVKK